MDKGCRRLDVPFGNDEVLTEGTRGAEITKGGTELIEVRDMGANGVTADIDVGMDRFGILPIPRVKKKNKKQTINDLIPQRLQEETDSTMAETAQSNLHPEIQ